jgi:hypothetical protein
MKYEGRRGEGFPVDCKEGVICPIYKTGEKNKAENYWGITLLNTGYKLYASILSERMKKEMEERRKWWCLRRERERVKRMSWSRRVWER